MLVRLILSPTPLNLGSSCHLELLRSKVPAYLTLPVHLFEGRCDIVYVNLTFPRASTSWEDDDHHFWSLQGLAAFHLTRRHLHLDHSL